MGLAYLPDGRQMDYKEYLKSFEWKEKRTNRLAFDNWECGICHERLDGIYETHHLNYSRLGHENIITDIISLCPRCHEKFHNTWKRQEVWSTTSINHWADFSLEETAKFCIENYNNDYFFGGEYNLCSIDTVRQFIDQYYVDHNLTAPMFIDENDIRLFFRNARYDVIITAFDRGESADDLCDRLFGKKGQTGGNKKRTEGKAFATKHTVASMKKHHNENKNVVELMRKVRQIQYKEKF